MTQSQAEPSIFHFLVLSLGNAALAGLGLVPEPGTEKLSRNLDMAQSNIEMLAMLHEKTRGNLTPAESQLLEGLLYDLRLKFVEANRRA